MDANAATYALIICATCGHLDVPGCEWQLPSDKSLTRQECVERLQITRWRHPHLRVICLAHDRSDVVDTAGELRPEYIMIAPQDRMDMLVMPK